ncbi:putative Ig domain-containing protein [Rhodococcus sp. OK519]|uniref:Ig domain-containing protein n=1 Tax=Rhodococcus sp. OK519 TaxID=2135729 RepID=UPI000D39599A|nr:putative Ig domain-containing protein [Rhodococcus sp. OK519]
MHTTATPRWAWIRRLTLFATVFAVALTLAAVPAGADPAVTGRPTLPTVSGTPPIGTVGVDYWFPFTATGAPAPLFRLDPDNDMPPGIRLINSGILAGKPTAGGTYDFTVIAYNSAGEVSVPVTMTVWQRPALTNERALPPMLAGEPYQFRFEATGYPKPTFRNTSVLPRGLTLSPDGLLSGTPTRVGPADFSVQLSNSAGDKTYRFDPTVGERLTITGTPDITKQYRYYRYRFATTGYPTPTVSLTRGELPAGLELSDDGELSGMPIRGGKYLFTVSAANETGIVDHPVTMEVLQHPELINLYDMPTMRVGEPFEYRFETSGYPKPVFAAGTELPDGLTLTPDGLLAGTPTTAGRVRFELRLTNSVDTRVHWLSEDVEQTPTVTGTPDTAQVNQPYEYRFALSGYPAPTVTVSSGDLPGGLTLSRAGVLIGSPTEAGTFTFTVTATNSAGKADLPVTLEVSQPPEPAPSGSTTSLNLSTLPMGLARALVKSAVMSVESPSTP